MKQYLIKWLVQSITGLVLTGAGLSISIDAGLHKLRGLSWFWQGTLGLILFQAGICLMIDSLVAKMRVKKILKWQGRIRSAWPTTLSSILSGFSLYYQCFCSEFFNQTREKSTHQPGQSGLSRKHNGWFIFFNCAKYFFCHLFNRIGGSRQNRQISSSILYLIPLLFILKWIS